MEVPTRSPGPITETRAVPPTMRSCARSPARYSSGTRFHEIAVRTTTLQLFVALLPAACVAPRGMPHPAPLGAIEVATLPASSSRFVLRFAATSADTLAVVGTRDVAERRRGALIERVIRYDYGGRGVTVDTTLSDARTLAPILERTHKSHGVIFLDFAGRVVTGRLTTRDSTHAIADTLGAPAFNSTDLDLVVRRLPLAAGYETRLPLYDPEFGGFRYADTRVGTRRTAEGGEAWLVQVHDGKLDCEYELDARTRAVRTIVVRLLASGGEYRMERVSE